MNPVESVVVSTFLFYSSWFMFVVAPPMFIYWALIRRGFPSIFLVVLVAAVLSYGLGLSTFILDGHHRSDYYNSLANPTEKDQYYVNSHGAAGAFFLLFGWIFSGLYALLSWFIIIAALNIILWLRGEDIIE